MTCGSKKKELDFFSHDENYAKGEIWYQSHFPLPFGRLKDAVFFESSPSYLYFPGTAERIHRYNPEMKMIVLLRDPVERAFSAWNMYRNFSSHRELNYLGEKRSFEEAIDEEMRLISQGKDLPPQLRPNYLRRGFYALQLEPFFKLFPQEQIFISDNRTLGENRKELLNRVAGFLGLSSYNWDGQHEKTFHVGAYDKAVLSNETRQRLREFYRPHNEALFRQLDRVFEWD